MNVLVKAGIVVLVVAGAAEWALRRDDPAAASTRGEALFRTKGCVTCHMLRGMSGERNWDEAIGPDLSDYTNDPAFLRRWLAEPSAVRADARMPDLDLSSAEIAELIVFINRE